MLAQTLTCLQQLTNTVLTGLDSVYGYMSGIFLYNSDPEMHTFGNSIPTFVKRRYKTKRNKIQYFEKKIQFWGHLISKTGIEPLPEK